MKINKSMLMLSLTSLYLAGCDRGADEAPGVNIPNNIFVTPEVRKAAKKNKPVSKPHEVNVKRVSFESDEGDIYRIEAERESNYFKVFKNDRLLFSSDEMSVKTAQALRPFISNMMDQVDLVVDTEEKIEGLVINNSVVDLFTGNDRTDRPLSLARYKSRLLKTQKALLNSVLNIQNFIDGEVHPSGIENAPTSDLINHTKGSSIINKHNSKYPAELTCYQRG